MIDSVFIWISDSALATWVISSPFIWPTLESIHFVSLCVLFGSLLLIDLRLIGFYRERCSPMVDWLIKLTLAAFAVNLVTGVLFFFGNTFKYVDNSAFELKLVLILIAGANAVFYKLRLSDIVAGNEVTRSSVFVGSLSLLLWAGVIICGRMITFYAP
ncbi:MAG: DUF6644 family protein [Gammaproteobacteria bacterium]|nr:DUF6644 family protein [Gammaproteobacteria bacterium]